MNSKVYDFYREYEKITKDKNNGLITVEEYLNKCQILNDQHKDEIYEEMKSSYDLEGYNKVFIYFNMFSISKIRLVKNKIIKASFQTPMLNIKPKTQQTKRALPRSIMRGVKKNADDSIYQQGEGRMRAYQEALLMLDKIKQSAEEQVIENDSRLKDRQDTLSPEKTQKENSKGTDLNIEEEDKQGMSRRSEK